MVLLFDKFFVPLVSKLKSIAEYYWDTSESLIGPFQANVSFLYPLKTPDNLWFFYFNRGYRNENTGLKYK